MKLKTFAGGLALATVLAGCGGGPGYYGGGYNPAYSMVPSFTGQGMSLLQQEQQHEFQMQLLRQQQMQQERQIRQMQRLQEQQQQQRALKAGVVTP